MSDVSIHTTLGSSINDLRQRDLRVGGVDGELISSAMNQVRAYNNMPGTIALQIRLARAEVKSRPYGAQKITYAHANLTRAEVIELMAALQKTLDEGV